MILPVQAINRKDSNVRRAHSGDLEAIVRLLDSAFAPSKFESGLVKALATSGRHIHHWVMEQDREVVAYVWPGELPSMQADPSIGAVANQERP